jgi:NADPH-dependent 2,4-dienoyl-CoA reductase/sulfur reductase-like enzyme
MEMADAMTQRRMSVTVVEHGEEVLGNVEPGFGRLIREKLEGEGVRVNLGVQVAEIAAEGARLVVRGSQGFDTKGDMVLIATGSQPMTRLAVGTDLALGKEGALKVNRKMETNIPDVLAAGDCVETWHRVLAENTYLPLGSTAHRQGRVAGENAAGGNREFQGTLGTQTVKIFDLVVARTGLDILESSRAGFDAAGVALETWDHKAYYPGAQKMHTRIFGDRATGRLLGGQILGHHGSEVAKRIDIVATALYQGMSIDELGDIDLSYTPPLSSPWDPVQMCGHAWIKHQQVT